MNRRRAIVLILAISLSFVQFISVGCSSKKKEESQSTTEGFDMKAASNVADTYMKYLMKEDTENSKKFYSKELSKGAANEENRNLKILGYDLSETNEIGKSGLFKINVSRADKSKPFASLDEYSLKIKKEGSDYKISETNNVVQKEAFIQNNQIRIRNKNNVNTSLVVDFGGIPNYAFSKDDKTNVDKITVPKNHYGIMTFAYTGDSLAISTFDKDAYIAIIKLDEAMSVQGSGQGGEGGDSEGGDKQKGGGGAGGGGQEKPIGKEITSLDLLKDTTVEFLTFSPTEKFITVQYTKPNVGHCIRVYQSDGGDLIPYKFEEKFPIDKVNILFSSYDKETINFDIVPKKANDKSAGDVIGKWQINLRDFKAKKM
ncbi:hypothetical protein [Clostridium thailandense]|uniref:hypothetical protein n=1 Tax=Clostridium thailandense TaxID=2794346 RepID=UPI00398972E5